MNMTRQNEIALLFHQNRLELAEPAAVKLDQFLNLVIETNAHLNLTAITAYEEAYIKHLYDSLALIALPEFAGAHSVIDIGSGAGFPGIPLAICFPDKQFLSLDSTQKKINFQRQACESLGLTNLKAVWGRAEELAHQADYRENFDLALARAVSQTNVLLELALPFMKVHAAAVFYKGKDYERELTAIENALPVLGAQLDRTVPYLLPRDFGERALVVIEKIEPTPSQYPRKPGVPQKKPL